MEEKLFEKRVFKRKEKGGVFGRNSTDLFTTSAKRGAAQEAQSQGGKLRALKALKALRANLGVA